MSARRGSKGAEKIDLSKTCRKMGHGQNVGIFIFAIHIGPKESLIDIRYEK